MRSSLFVLCCTASFARAQTPAAVTDYAFVASSIGSSYPLQGEFHGTYRVDSAAIIVRVDRALIANALPLTYGDSGVLTAYGLAVGIGRLTTAGWTDDTTGTMQIVADTVVPQGYRRLASLTFVVPYSPGTDLSPRWIFFELSVVHRGIFQLAPGKRFYNYACVPANILGSTPESETRAARMKIDYATTC